MATSKATAPKEPPPAETPTTAAPETLLIHFTKFTLLADGEVAAAGDVRRILDAEAAKHVAAGRATFAGARVRVLRPYLVGSVWREVGDEFELPLDMALSHHRMGGLAIVDTSSLSGNVHIPAVEPRPKRTEPPDPYANEPRVTIKALRTVAIPGGSLGAGEEGEVPEVGAARAVAAGAAQLVGLYKWTDRAFRLLEALRNPNPVRPTPVY
jgi:hypothetical protein